MLVEIISVLHTANIPVLIAGSASEVDDVLLSSGIIERLGGRKFCTHRVHEAVSAVINGTVSPDALPKPTSAVTVPATSAVIPTSNPLGCSGISRFCPSLAPWALTRQPASLAAPPMMIHVDREAM